MPTYRYRCAKCGEELEIWQSFEDKALTRHAGGCGGKLAKVLSPAGIVLKGSGFYKTDNRSSSKSGKRSPSEPTTSSSSTGDSGSSSSSAPSDTATKRDATGSSSTKKKDAGAASS